MADLDFQIKPLTAQPGYVFLRVSGTVPADVGAKIFNLLRRTLAQMDVADAKEKTLRIAHKQD